MSADIIGEMKICPKCWFDGDDDDEGYACSRHSDEYNAYLIREIINPQPWINAERARLWQELYDDPVIAMQLYCGEIQANIYEELKDVRRID